MHLVKLFIISILYTTSFALYAQDTIIQMDRMDKTDLVQKRISKEVRVVSASRSSRNVNDLPISIQVVTHEEIAKNGYVTLIDLLKHISGVRVSKPGNGFDGETFLMRGLIGNYYTKILINNIPIQPSVTGSISIAEHLPIGEADRVEIIFGPSSSIYGGDAMAGVINIITRSTEGQPFAQATLYWGEDGYRYASFSAGGKAGRDKDIVRYSLYANFSERQDLNVHYDTENYNPINSHVFPDAIKPYLRANPDIALLLLKEDFPFYAGTATSPTISNLPQSSYMLGGQVEYRGWQLAYLEMKREASYSIGVNPMFFRHDSPDILAGEKIRRITLSHNKDWEKWSMTSNVSYNSYRTLPLSSRASSYSGFNGRSYKFAASDDIFAEYLLRSMRNKKNEFTLGISAQLSGNFPETNDLEKPFERDIYHPFTEHKPAPHALYGDFGYNPLVFFNAGFFGQWVRNGQRWSHILAVRHDRNSVFGSQERWRFAAQYKLTETFSVRASLGGAYKNPSSYLRFSSTALPGDAFGGINYQQVPNPSLQPELLQSIELGARWQITPNTFFEFITYSQRLTKRINNVYKRIDEREYPRAERNAIVDGNLLAFSRVYANDDSSFSALTSWQFILKHQNLFEKLNMNIDASVTLNRGNERIYGDSAIIKQYRMVPLFLGQFNVDFTPHKNWYVRLESVWSSKFYRRYIPVPTDYNSDFNTIKGYFTLDIIARYQWSKHVRTSLRILNVLDTQYGGIDASGLDIDLRYNPQLGRNVQFGLHFDLD